MEMRLDYEQQKSQFEITQQQLELDAQRNKFYILLLVGLVLISIIVSYFIIRLHRAKRQAAELTQQKTEEELAFKNKELTTNVLSLMKKNELLVEISKKMSAAQKLTVNKEAQHAISKIAKELQKSVETEIWEEFEVRFKEIHAGFYDNLINAYPNLTPNELKLIAFLRLNMSTKDISELTGQQTRAIEQARFRLRKKLSIASGKVNLVAFLSQY